MFQNLINTPQHKLFPAVSHAIVEIPKDTNAKYEYDGELNMLRLDRCLISSLQYPASYGFLPQTLSDDGDPTDILIYNTVPILPLTLVNIRVIGALKTNDDGKQDYKIFGIPTYNPNNYIDIDDLDSTFLKVCEDFFTIYKRLGKKQNPIKIRGWLHHEDAQKYLKNCHAKFKKL